MKDSGVAIMGTGIAEGENRAREAVEDALNSPLLNDNNITGANNILLYIASGAEEISMDEVSEITDFIQNESGYNAEIIWGNGIEESLEHKISITIIATGFKPTHKNKKTTILHPDENKIVHSLGETGLIDDIISEESEEGLINEITLINKSEEDPVNKIEPETRFKEKERTVTFDLSVKDKENKYNENERRKVRLYENDILDKSDILEEKDHGHLVDPEDQDTIDDTEKSEIEKRAKERIKKLKDLSIKLKTPGGLAELEKEPAYVRRNVELTDPPPASDSEISRYTLSPDDENQTEIKSNNSFLHDNVD